jgi:hypothetical protein
MVHIRLDRILRIRQRGPLGERAAAGWAPVDLGIRPEDGMAMSADSVHITSFHTSQTIESLQCLQYAWQFSSRLPFPQAA